MSTLARRAAATLSSTLDVFTGADAVEHAERDGSATLSSTLDVAGDVDVNSGKFAVTASDGSLAIATNKFTVAGGTGNTVVAGTLNATGATTLSSTLDVAGDVDVNSGKFGGDGSLAIANMFTVAATRATRWWRGR